MRGVAWEGGQYTGDHDVLDGLGRHLCGDFD